MKPGDLITGIKYKAQIRLIVDEYYEQMGNGLPPFRVFRMLEEDGSIEEWGANNIELYWEVISEGW